MTHDVAGGPGSAGRHRSPWGKPGRILPIRWGRIIAVVVALALVVVSLVLIRGRLAGDGRAAGPVHRSGVPTAPFAPSAQRPSDVLTATTATHRPSSTAAASSTPAVGSAAATTTAPAPAIVSPSGAPTGVRSRAAGRSGAAVVPVAPRPTGSVLAVSATTVDLGPVDSVWRLDLRGEGTAPVDVAVGASPSWLAVVPDRPRVNPGADVPLVITLDRSVAPPGPVDVTVPVNARNGVGGADVRITASVDGPPRIQSVTAAPDRIVRAGCPPAAGVARSTVTVTALDETGIFAVELAAVLPGGRTTTESLSLGQATGDRSTWTGTLASTQDPGTINYTATVTDLEGRRSQSSGSLVVLPCPS
ncbi:hypothetical protein FF36_04715 [Frankia torreyi]|uniref:BACON domain-containing protein n=1 Tax=Frankia torreyi TaxID=1856 RepID=A0A0D8B9T3_9ACTN|nr:hypothetical protein FF36_04715 [Frankia torreyi]KQM03811.1 hypothetical protein FF86_103427 [Frankia sp. CpI1-P]